MQRVFADVKYCKKFIHCLIMKEIFAPAEHFLISLKSFVVTKKTIGVQSHKYRKSLLHDFYIKFVYLSLSHLKISR